MKLGHFFKLLKEKKWVHLRENERGRGIKQVQRMRSGLDFSSAPIKGTPIKREIESRESLINELIVQL